MQKNKPGSRLAIFRGGWFHNSIHYLLAILMILSFIAPLAVNSGKVAAQTITATALQIFAQIPLVVQAPVVAGARADTTAMPAGLPLGTVPLLTIDGVVTAKNVAGTEWQIGTQPFVVYTHAGTRVDLAPNIGDVVKVTAQRTLAPGPIVADRITRRALGPQTPAPASVVLVFQFNGTVQSVGLASWTISGSTFAVNDPAAGPAVIALGLAVNSLVTVVFTAPVAVAPAPVPAPAPAPGTVPAPAPVPAGPPMIGLEIFAQIPIAVQTPLAAGAQANSTAIPVGGPLGSVPLFVIFGGITAVNAAGTAWQIGTPPTLVYSHIGTKLVGGPAVGSIVRIIALRTVAPGPIMADVIEVKPGVATPVPADVQVISLLFNGIVTAISPPAANGSIIWTVGGVDFEAAGAVIDPGLVVGTAVTVEFSPPIVLPPGTPVIPPAVPATGVAATAPMTFGPINPTTAVPRWFRDAAGIALDFCVDPLLCIADPVITTIPFSVQTGFGGEAFYWSAGADMPTAGGNASLILGWEVAYLNGDPAPGETILFGRIRVLATGLTPGATYTVTHPYGTDTFVAAVGVGNTAGLARQIFATDDVGCFAVPCDFNAALASRIKRFLVWDPAVVPLPPSGYVGDGVSPHRVIGSPLGTNFFRMDGPNVGGPGINSIQTDRFVVTGKILPAVATAISLTAANPVIAVGAIVPLTVAVMDQFGMPITTATTLTSSNPAVGTVNPITSMFTAVAPGTTTITATSGVFTASMTLTVSSPTPVLTTINVTPATATVVVGSTQALTISMRDQFSALFTIPPPALPAPAPATPPATAPIPLAAAPTAPTFSSSNPLIGTVDPVTGLFTAIGAGTAIVTATSGTVTGTATVRVTTAAPALGSLAITPPTASIAIGATRTFTASALDQFGVAIPTSATFASSNGAVGTINAAGVFTPLGTGTTTISATNGTIIGSATVTVTSPGMRAAAPIAAATGYPRYYTDASGLSLEPCLDTNGFCVLAPLPNPAAALAFPGNFPDESFYYIADSNPINIGPAGAGRARMRMVLEAAFATGAPAAGQQMTFLRLNLARTTGLTPNSTYTATYPFGTFTFTTDATGIAGASLAGQAFRTEEGCAGAPCDFTLVLPAPVTHMTNFLTWTGLPPGGLLDLATGNRYIGDGGTPHTIIPGPSGNFFRITGPNIGGPGVNTIQTDLWTVSGKIAPAAVLAAAAAPVTAAAATPIGVVPVAPVAPVALVAPVAPTFTPTIPGTLAATPARPPVRAEAAGGGGGGGQVFGGGGGAVAPITTLPPASGTATAPAPATIAVPPGTIAPAKGPVKISTLSAPGGNAPAAPRQPVRVEMGGVEYRVDFTQFNPAGQVSTVVAIKGGITVSYGSVWAGFTPDQILADAIFNNDAIGQAVALAGGAKPLGEVK